MRWRMQRADRGEELQRGRWDLAIVGCPVDQRGRAAHDFVSACTASTCFVSYDPDGLQVAVDTKTVESDELTAWIAQRGAKSLLLEATTLGFPEILLCCRAVRELKQTTVSLLYLEPREYFTPRRTVAVHRRDFELSDEITGFAAIPGSAFLMADGVAQQVVFFLGYEGHRLDQAFEQLGLQPDQCFVVLGVPAFRPGWEMNSFANNIRVLRERKVQGGAGFCAADNPAAAYDLLVDRRREIGLEQRLIVAPIGTKPHGIGAAVFAAMHEETGILYDHPQRRRERTSQTAVWHLYNVDFDA